jgi:hypothetical protein
LDTAYAVMARPSRPTDGLSPVSDIYVNVPGF